MTTPVQLPLKQAHPLQPARGLRALQARGSVHRVRTATGDPAWLVTGYQDVQQLLADPRIGRSHPTPASAARTGESALFAGPVGKYKSEEADHARMRSLLRPHFAPKRMRVLRPRVEALTTRLLDALARRDLPADLIEALAVPLADLVICELLGVPYEDRDRFRTCARDAADARDLSHSRQGLAALFGYGRDLVARKREHPGDDVISRLCATDGVADEEIAMLSMFLLFAGRATTVVTIGLGTLMLLTHPAQWQALRGDLGLIPAAVEETLRAADKGGGGILRYARTDLEISGVTIRAGELVLLDNGAANHDESVFPRPDQFDITRQPAPHLAFGHGARYCLGAPLARIELQAVFSQLITRFPTMCLAVPAGELTLNRDTLADGLAQLPVIWRP